MALIISLRKRNWYIIYDLQNFLFIVGRESFLNSKLVISADSFQNQVSFTGTDLSNSPQNVFSIWPSYNYFTLQRNSIAITAHKQLH